MPEYMQGMKQPVNIEDEMRKSYMDYAMSVIIGRALPEVRDGLKPVHRRVLYSMHESGAGHTKPYRKSARIVGDVMGRYHPHGDAAIYDTIVRLVQDFSMRYPLIDGQGNFGSVDGDMPAAMRYTEVRLERLAGEMLSDLDKETVEFVPNYDGSLQEPEVLPSALPNLLCNGSSGIAVGMTTNVPPHNLGEVVDALIALLDNPVMTIEELMRYIPGPDFPTGGFIYGAEGIVKAYKTGRGTIQLRALASVERLPKGERTHIIVSELPYQVNKARLLERIAELTRNKKIEGISDLRDESDRDGMRVVVELKRGEVPEIVLNQLFAHTQMQVSFGIILLAIEGRRPRFFNIKTMLEAYLGHRREVVIRRTLFDLRRAEEKLEILAGLMIAVDNIDEVVSMIRASADPETAKAALMRRFELTERQAQAILDMRLQRLTGLEREKIAVEFGETKKLIGELEALLASEELQRKVVADELRQLKERYGDERRTEIVAQSTELQIEDLIKEEPMVITITNSNYIKRTAVTTYRKQRRGGKGRIGMITKEEDWLKHLFIASTHDYILIFTQLGQVFWLKVHELPEVGAAGRGKPIVNLIQIAKEDNVAAIIGVREFGDRHNVIMVTRGGSIKKTPLTAFSNPRSSGIIAIGLRNGDTVLDAKISDGNSFVVLSTRNGKAIRFKEADVRPMGRTAQGVRAITLRSGDELVGMEVVGDVGTLLTATERGYGKRTLIEHYPVQRRGGQGVVNLKTSDKTGKVVSVEFVSDDDEVMLISSVGKILRTKTSGISVLGRATQGVRLLDLEEEDLVVALARVMERD
jgi:DNA gyrase subunit A